MSAFFRKRPIRVPLFFLSLLGLISALLLLYWQIWIGSIVAALFLIVLVIGWQMEKRLYEETEKHIETLVLSDETGRRRSITRNAHRNYYWSMNIGPLNGRIHTCQESLNLIHLLEKIYLRCQMNFTHL